MVLDGSIIFESLPKDDDDHLGPITEVSASKEASVAITPYLTRQQEEEIKKQESILKDSSDSNNTSSNETAVYLEKVEVKNPKINAAGKITYTVQGYD